MFCFKCKTRERGPTHQGLEHLRLNLLMMAGLPFTLLALLDSVFQSMTCPTVVSWLSQDICFVLSMTCPKVVSWLVKTMFCVVSHGYYLNGHVTAGLQCPCRSPLNTFSQALSAAEIFAGCKSITGGFRHAQSEQFPSLGSVGLVV